MSNTSATGGYLTPASPVAPEWDKSLDVLVQSAIVGITGLPGSLVRPRWQAPMPKQPEPSTDWCSIGVPIVEPDANGAMVHVGVEDEHDVYSRHEGITLLCTFYGPNGQSFAALLRDGIAVPQNMEALKRQRIGLVSTSEIRSVPEFVNQQWVRRYDIELRLRRKVIRRYPILNILSADINVGSD
ncbi:LIC_12616 family protein [Microvirgula aerodenitrificans]|uniref:phage neck terminator protein n=1 Tax=Microvirgula aerodenitrificans TaxID=57480 RepID=UPI0028EE5651|nr:hypothetical protein [Microvirgula aerodenitrificans]